MFRCLFLPLRDGRALKKCDGERIGSVVPPAQRRGTATKLVPPTPTTTRSVFLFFFATQLLWESQCSEQNVFRSLTADQGPLPMLEVTVKGVL